MNTDTPQSPRRARKRRAKVNRPPAPANQVKDDSHPRATNAVRVLCVDDHAVLIDGLKVQFAIDGRAGLAGALLSARNLLDEVRRLEPDLVLLDIEMPGPDVFELADRLHHEFPDVRFMFLSAHVRDGYLAAAYKCGASGYFSKGDDPEHIVAGIVQVARSMHSTFIMGPKVRQQCQPRLAGASQPSQTRIAKTKNTIESAPDAPPPTTLDTLTQREIEVLRLIGKGLSRSEIAGELSRSAKTIDGHQDRIMKKLGIDSRADLMRFAIREGLAQP